MTDIATTSTPALKDAARTTIRAVLIEADPSLDISIGGAVDSIIVEGNVDVAANNQVNVNQSYLFQQLQAIANGTVTISDAQMDALMQNYYITRQQNVPAFGDTAFVVRDNKQYVIQTGYRVRYGASSYVTTATYTVYPQDTPGIDFTVPTNVPLLVIFDQATGFNYQFRIPFVCEQAGPTGIRIAGQVFVPDTTFTALGSITAISNFQGGTLAETNAELAQRALEGITAGTLSGGQDGINKLVSEFYPAAVASSVGVNSPMQTRGRNNPFGLNYAGVLDVYVKSGAIGQNQIIVSAVVTNYLTRTATITLLQPDSAGVYSAVAQGTSSPVGMTGALVSSPINYLPYTSPVFNPNTASSLQRAFSASTLVQITITDNRVDSLSVPIVPMTSNGQVITGAYTVVVQNMPGINDVATGLYSDAIRPPGVDVLVKAAVPCVTTLNITAAMPANYNGPSASDLAVAIAQAINELPLRTAALDSFTISQIIQAQSSNLVLRTLNMSGTIYGQDGSLIPVYQLGTQLIIPTNLPALVSAENAFFATTQALVTVNLV